MSCYYAFCEKIILPRTRYVILLGHAQDTENYRFQKFIRIIERSAKQHVIFLKVLKFPRPIFGYTSSLQGLQRCCSEMFSWNRAWKLPCEISAALLFSGNNAWKCPEILTTNFTPFFTRRFAAANAQFHGVFHSADVCLRRQYPFLHFNSWGQDFPGELHSLLAGPLRPWPESLPQTCSGPDLRNLENKRRQDDIFFDGGRGHRW